MSLVLPPKDGTTVAVTNSALLTSYFEIVRLRALGPEGWSATSALFGATRANYEISREADGSVSVTGLRTGDELFRGHVTHESVARLNLALNLSAPGCIFYDLEGK